MKVDGPGSSSSVSKSKKAAKKSSAGGVGFSQQLRGGDEEAASRVDQSGGIAGGAALGSIDALLAIQGVEPVKETDPDEKGANRQAVERGTDLLDRLDEIRVALLTGRLTQDMLVNVRDALARRTGGVQDDGLKSAIQDIELRVEVELAKYERR